MADEKVSIEPQSSSATTAHAQMIERLEQLEQAIDQLLASISEVAKLPRGKATGRVPADRQRAA